MVQYPFALQYIRSMLPYAAWRHPMLTPVAHACTWIWVTAYTAAALLFLVRAVPVRMNSAHGEVQSLY